MEIEEVKKQKLMEEGLTLSTGCCLLYLTIKGREHPLFALTSVLFVYVYQKQSFTAAK